VGLLLQALQHSSQGQSVAALLQPQQLEQLCELVCANGSSSSLTGALPTVEQLAQGCADVTQLSGAAAPAQLLNALCRDHPELQPSTAAAALGVVGADLPPSAADTAPSIPATKRHASTVAALCFNQLAAHRDLSQDPDSLDAALSEWVSQLSPQAAAAALLAAGLSLVQPGVLPVAATCVPAGVAVSVLCQRLYMRAKATGDRLVFDLGLVSAAETAAVDGNWGTGRVAAPGR
jgi:hypothetical protein